MSTKGEVIKIKKNKIYFTAPISPDSSGGVVFNSYSKVIEIVRAYRKGTQNINIMIPVSI